MIATRRIDHALLTLKSAFLEEVPGTPLTLQEASRVAGLEPDICLAVLNALEDVRFVQRTGPHTFTRAERSRDRIVDPPTEVSRDAYR
jgi:hypothetical protein